MSSLSFFTMVSTEEVRTYKSYWQILVLTSNIHESKLSKYSFFGSVLLHLTTSILTIFSTCTRSQNNESKYPIGLTYRKIRVTSRISYCYGQEMANYSQTLCLWLFTVPPSHVALDLLTSIPRPTPWHQRHQRVGPRQSVMMSKCTYQWSSWNDGW